jgi:hypothetical protein
MDHTAGDSEASPVLAQDLKSLRVPGKVAAVLWTVRSDRCTLQVVMPIPGYGSRPATARDPTLPYQRPTIDLWLLGPNGTVISPHYRWDSPNPGGKGLTVRPTGAEVNFQFPREASRLAVAAVLTVDGQQRVETIRRLGN